MDIQIIKDHKTPIYMQIRNAIKDGIIRGEFADGYKLPTERALAKRLAVHRNTVIKAYSLLVDEKYIRVSQKPKGYFVTFGQGESIRQKQYLSQHFMPFEYIVSDEFLQTNALFSRLFYTAIDRKIISFATAMPSTECYPTARFNAILNQLTKEKADLIYGYANPQGVLLLRKQLSEMLELHQIRANASEITVCAETYQALDYLVKLTVSQGETIIVEEPINPDIFDLIKLLGVNIVTIPTDGNGMIVDYLENLILKFKPKFVLTIPTFHNPTMSVMSLDRREALLELSYRYNIPIIEINHDSGLRYEGIHLPSLKAMDTLGNVIYIDSFIFRAIPGVKLAYIVSSKGIAQKLARILEKNQIFLSTLDQYAMMAFLTGGHYEAHVKAISETYREKRDFMAVMLKKYCSEYLDFEIPKGGASLWCRMKIPVDQTKLLIHAESMGVSFAPGHLFFPYGNADAEYIRISYSALTKQAIEEGVILLQKAIEKAVSDEIRRKEETDANQTMQT
jgi:DNA-binding transcriptional MocR family regulator